MDDAERLDKAMEDCQTPNHMRQGLRDYVLLHKRSGTGASSFVIPCLSIGGFAPLWRSAGLTLAALGLVLRLRLRCHPRRKAKNQQGINATSYTICLSAIYGLLFGR